MGPACMAYVHEGEDSLFRLTAKSFQHDAQDYCGVPKNELSGRIGAAV